MNKSSLTNYCADCLPPFERRALPEGIVVPRRTSQMATLNLLLVLWGYAFCGALLSPVSVIMGVMIEESWYLTYPVRVLQIVVALWVIFFTRDNCKKMSWTNLHGLIILLLLMSDFRLFYDIHIKGLIPYVGSAWKCWTLHVMDWLFVFSVIKSIHLVDFDKLFKWMFWGGFVGVVCSLWSVDAMVAAEEALTNSNQAGGRAIAGAAMHTQTLGNYAIKVMMIAGYCFIEKGWKIDFVKIIAVVIMGLSLWLCIKAGSRGPFLALIVVVLFYLLARVKYAVVALPVGGLVAVIGWLSRFQIVKLFGLFNPVIEQRLLATLERGDSSGRDELVGIYLEKIKDNPFMGVYHIDIAYAHCTLIDGFAMYGVLLGWLYIVPVVLAMVFGYRLIKSGDHRGWLAIFVLAMFSQCATQSGALETGVVLIAALYILKTSRGNANLILNRGPVL